MADLRTMQNDVSLGYSEPLELLIALKQIQDTIDKISSDLNEDFLKSANQFNKQEYLGYTVEVRTGGGRYEYDHIPEYIELSSRLKAIQDVAKQSYRLSLSNNNMVSDDGEVMVSAKFIPYKDSIVLKKKG
ncbi:MAG: hypothetical protein ACO295_03165 [Sediminibacterium sp.]